MKKRRKTISHLGDDTSLYVARLQKKSPQVFFAEREVETLLFSPSSDIICKNTDIVTL